MDHDDARAAMIKAVRREILSVLNVMYSIGPFNFTHICYALTHLEVPDEECVRRDMTYLVDKGYVKWTNKKPMQPWNKRTYKLTPTGNEIANKIASDPALEP